MMSPNKMSVGMRLVDCCSAGRLAAAVAERFVPRSVQ